MTKLPNTLRGLWRVALEDLERVEKDPRYVVNMGVWHTPQAGKPCEVCAAGAVIARRLGVRPDLFSGPGHFDVDAYNKLMAIDELRCGGVRPAYRYLHGGRDRLLILHDFRPEVDYGHLDWWPWAEGLLGYLEAERV